MAHSPGDSVSRPSAAKELLRAAGPQDIDQLVAIEEACFTHYRMTRRQWRYFLARPQTARGYVIEVAGRIAGSVLLLFRRTAANARLFTLAIHPEMRGHGYARALLAKAEEEAARHGKNRLSLEIHQANAAAKALYDSLGFTPSAMLPGYYPDGDGLRMTKLLS